MCEYASLFYTLLDEDREAKYVLGGREMNINSVETKQRKRLYIKKSGVQGVWGARLL